MRGHIFLQDAVGQARELAVPIVVVEEIAWSRPVGDDQVGVSVVVEVTPGGVVGVSSRVSRNDRVGDRAEGSVAAGVEEEVGPMAALGPGCGYEASSQPSLS